MKLKFLALRLMRPTEGDEGGGGFDTEQQDAAVSQGLDEGGDTGAETPAAAPTDADKPASMLDAINQALETPEQKAERLRDEKGRFAAKTDEQLAADAAKPKLPGAQTPPAAKDPNAPKPPQDDLQMPEGLQPKAQQRFQTMANELRELRPMRERVAELDNQVSYVKQAFREHAVKPEQFERATAVIGMMNRGDLEGALQVLDKQRAMIALAIGRPLEETDPLAQFPDLRQAVDNMQITTGHAMEIARARFTQHAGHQQREQETQQQQAQQAAQQEHQQAQLAVDAVCRRLQAVDMDYPAIEAKLIPELGNILAGVHPSQWAQKVETQYRLLKQMAGAQRQIPTGTSALRPTGQASPKAQPKSMFEAMFGESPGA